MLRPEVKYFGWNGLRPKMKQSCSLNVLFSSIVYLWTFWIISQKINQRPYLYQILELFSRFKDVWIHLHKQAKLAWFWGEIWHLTERKTKSLTGGAKKKRNWSVTLSMDPNENVWIVLSTDNVLKILHKTHIWRDVIAEDSPELHLSPCSNLENYLKYGIVPHYLHYILNQ